MAQPECENEVEDLQIPEDVVVSIKVCEVRRIIDATSMELWPEGYSAVSEQNAKIQSLEATFEDLRMKRRQLYKKICKIWYRKRLHKVEEVVQKDFFHAAIDGHINWTEAFRFT